MMTQRIWPDGEKKSLVVPAEIRDDLFKIAMALHKKDPKVLELLKQLD